MKASRLRQVIWCVVVMLGIGYVATSVTRTGVVRYRTED